MSSGAMTCPVRRRIREFQRSRLWESTNLNLSEDVKENNRAVVSGNP